MSEIFSQICDIVRDHSLGLLTDYQVFDLVVKLIYHQEKEIEYLKSKLTIQAELLDEAEKDLEKASFLLDPNCPRQFNVVPTRDDINNALLKIREARGNG